MPPFNNKAAGGYWNLAYMMVQAEDVGGVLKALCSWCARFEVVVLLVLAQEEPDGVANEIRALG